MAKKKDKQTGKAEMPSTEVIEHHASAIQVAKKDMATEAGHVSAAHERAKNAGIHKKAMSWCLVLRNMDPAKRDEMLHHFDLYREALDIKVQGDFFRSTDTDAPRNVSAAPTAIQ